MSEKFRPLGFATKLRRIAVVASFVSIVTVSNVSAQQQSELNAGAREPFAKGLSSAQQQDALPAPQQDRKQTLVYFLEALQADPDAPQIWYQLGLTLAKMPGYKAPASVWLDAYLLTVPSATNAAAIRTQARQLGAASERQREKHADQLEAIALDTRGAIYDKRGQVDLAIADFRRALQLDPKQDRAKEALKRLEESKKNKIAVSPIKPTGTCGASQGDYIVVNVLWDDDAGGLAIRTSPSSQSAMTALIPRTGIGIGVNECQSGWCRVKYGCDSGWSSAGYLARRETQLFKVIGVSPSDPEGLNVRKEPNSTSAVESAIPYDATDIVVHVCQPSPLDQTRWCLVTYRDNSGWASARFLTR